MKRLLKLLPVLLPVLLAACGDADSRGEQSQSSEMVFLDPSPTEVTAPPPPRDQAVTTGRAAGVQGGAYSSGALQTTTVQADTGGGPEPIPPPGVDPVAPGATLAPMLIRTGRAQVRVDSLEAGIARVRALAQRLGGIVGNTNITAGTEQERLATMELRIPAASFDQAISGLSPIGEVESVNVTAEDVGEEYTDVTARVANARRLESRLLDLLDRRTGRLEEMLAVEREVSRVREEIERYEGRLRYLRTRAAVSTLTISLVDRAGGMIGPPGDHPIRDAFRQAIRNLVNFIAWLIAASGILIPLALLGYLFWRLRHRLRARDTTRPATILRRPPSHQEQAEEEVR